MKKFEPTIHLDRLSPILIERISALDEDTRERAMAAEPGSTRIEHCPTRSSITIGWADPIWLGDLALSALLDDSRSTN